MGIAKKADKLKLSDLGTEEGMNDPVEMERNTQDMVGTPEAQKSLDIYHDDSENIAKEVAPGPHCRCPNQGAQGVKEEEITPPYPTHAESKGGYCAQAIKEAESKNQGSLVEAR